MSLRRCAFIGGTAHGRGIRVDTSQPTISIAVEYPAPADESETVHAPPKDLYRREVFVEGERKYIVYVHSSIRFGDIMGRILTTFTN